ncbi:hypothetical protein ACYCAX_22975 [Pseudomonas sp. MT3]|nr:hypothetical protein [uncultured Pseudomonas sp.]
MCDNKGWSIQSINSNVKRYFWFTPDYWASFKNGFLAPKIITIQHLQEINKNIYPGFKNMFCAGIGYALGGQNALTYSGFGWYVSKVPYLGQTTINRMDNEIKSQIVYQLGGMASAVAIKYMAMNHLGTLTRAALQFRHPAACATALAAIKFTNYLNTAGGTVAVINQYNLIREQKLVKSCIKSCESYGQGELEKILENAIEGLSKPAPGEV